MSLDKNTTDFSTLKIGQNIKQVCGIVSWVAIYCFPVQIFALAHTMTVFILEIFIASKALFLTSGVNIHAKYIKGKQGRWH